MYSIEWYLGDTGFMGGAIMAEPEMTRNQFLCGGSCFAAGAILSGMMAPECAHCEEQQCPSGTATAEDNKQNVSKCPGMSLRPYQLLCAVCSLGEEGSGPEDKKLKGIREKLGNSPDMPITLRCNMREVFGFQTSGPEEDTAEGADFNKRRDLDILLRLNVPPGVTLSARILFNRLLDRITTVSGICDYEAATSDGWKGCPKAKSGRYEKAREKAAEAIIPPRSEEEKAGQKKASLEAMYQAKTTGMAVKPHLLLCAVCQYGGGSRPPFKPDNLPELIQLILKEPDALITMTEGAPWMMCGPCPAHAPELNACVNVQGSGGLTNQLRDLRTLQILGLTFGSTMKAKDLYERVFERIPSTLAVCRFESPEPSVWWDSCGARETNNTDYEKGRDELMKEFG
ncbi:MAG: hypothetical protein ABIK89_17335 [Planctomycetota bacterium]